MWVISKRPQAPEVDNPVLIPRLDGEGNNFTHGNNGGRSGRFNPPADFKTCEERYRLFMFLDIVGAAPRCSEYSSRNVAFERCLENSKEEFLDLFPNCEDWVEYMESLPDYFGELQTEIQKLERRIAITLVDYDGDCDRALAEYEGGLEDQLDECTDPRYGDPSWCISSVESAWGRRFPECRDDIETIIAAKRPNIVNRLIERLGEQEEGYPHCSEQYEWTRQTILECMEHDTHESRSACFDVHGHANSTGETLCDELQYQWLEQARNISYSMRFHE